LEDRQLAGLQLAHRYWLESRNADNTIKRSFARDIHAFELFSLNQLAKIVRTNVKNVAMELKANSGGGRFEPEALSTLVAIRKCVLEGTRVAPSLLRIALGAGCSYSCVVTLTGIKYSSYYREIPKEFRREEIADSNARQAAEDSENLRVEGRRV
jgi:hypothetical protein